MAVKIKDLAGMIQSAGKAQRVVTSECPWIEGFMVKIAFVGKFLMDQMRDRAREFWTNPRTGQREERFSNVKIREGYADHVILGWEGLTVDGLKTLLPGLELGDDIERIKKIFPDLEIKNKKDVGKAPVPFDKELVLALLETSLEFETWVVSVATDLKNYSEIGERKEAQQENLK